MLFQVDRKSVSTSRNGEIVSEYVSTRQKTCLHWHNYVKNQRKLFPIAVIRILNRLLCNLNNGFHQQDKKF